MSAEERKNTPPELGDADTVFADGNGVSTYVDVDADGNPVTVIKTAKALFDGAPKSAYASIAKKLIMKEYAGQTLPLGKNDLVRITNASGGEYDYPSNTLPTNSKEYNAKMRASAELHNLLENSTYDHWAADKKNHAEAALGFDYYKTVFVVDGKVFEGLINIANSENGRVFYDITNIKEVPDYTRKYAAPLARSSSAFGNLYIATIRQTEGNSQEKSSGKASVEVSGINNRTATELDGADTVFADGSISALSVERKITPETNEEARYEILKDRTIRPASVEYDKLGDTDTAAIYDGLSAAQMAQAKKAIRAIAKKLGLNQVDLKNSQIEFPFRFSNANAGVSAQHQSEYGGLYMTIAMTKIKESDVVKKLQAGESAAVTSLLSDPNISIQDIFQSVKAGDGRFRKYAPDAFLNDEQKAEKRRAIQRQTVEDASYKIDGNGRASVEVKNRNTEMSEEDARRDFSPAGEPPRVHLAADSFCSITHALMPQKLRLRRNRSAFFSPRQRQTAFPSVQIPSRKAYTKKDSLPHRAGNPFWYARRDLNPRPLAPEANTLSS